MWPPGVPGCLMGRRRPCVFQVVRMACLVHLSFPRLMSCLCWLSGWLADRVIICMEQGSNRHVSSLLESKTGNTAERKAGMACTCSDENGALQCLMHPLEAKRDALDQLENSAAGLLISSATASQPDRASGTNYFIDPPRVLLPH